MKAILSIITSLFFGVEASILPIPNLVTATHSIPKPQQGFYAVTQNTAVLGLKTSSSSGELQEPREIKIAILGDSMIDTMGPGFPELEQGIIELYPTIKPIIINYGAGGETIEKGIIRITDNNPYNGTIRPSLASEKPDVVIIESFAYNPFTDEPDLNRHWLGIAKAVDTVEKELPDATLFLAATIAPNSEIFGDSTKLGLTKSAKKNSTDLIKDYLRSTIRFATGEKIPLIDVFSYSLQSDGDGDPKFINPDDDIHPSEEGRLLFAEKTIAVLQDAGIFDETAPLLE